MSPAHRNRRRRLSTGVVETARRDGWRGNTGDPLPRAQLVEIGEAAADASRGRHPAVANDHHAVEAEA